MNNWYLYSFFHFIWCSGSFCTFVRSETIPIYNCQLKFDGYFHIENYSFWEIYLSADFKKRNILEHFLNRLLFQDWSSQWISGQWISTNLLEPNRIITYFVIKLYPSRVFVHFRIFTTCINILCKCKIFWKYCKNFIVCS